jgi:Rrf2 family protein
MYVYGKMAAKAVSIISYLVAKGRAGSIEIAQARKISPALTAKLLTHLATAGFVKGQPGPHGGYSLNRAAKSIRLYDIAAIFESMDLPSLCPYGEGWCGTGERCPLHDRFQAIFRQQERFMKNTRLSVFAAGAVEESTLPMTALQKRFRKFRSKPSSQQSKVVQ